MKEGIIRLYTYRAKKDGRFPIVIWYTVAKGKKIMRSTGYHARLDEWDFKRNLPARKHPGGTALARELEKMAMGIPVPHDSFCHFGGTLVREMQARGNDGNAQAYETAIERFRPFCAGWPSYRELVTFKNQLLADGLRMNSTATYLRTLRAIWNEAERRELVQGKTPFKRGLIQQEETAKRHLLPAQVDALMKLDGLARYKDRSRMLWLLMASMRGLDVIDVMAFEPSRFRDGYYIAEREKTGVPLKIWVPPIYHAFCDRGYLNDLKRMRDPRRNLIRELNEVGRMAGFDLQFKMARHTFAMAAKLSGCPIDVIREMLGHSAKGVTNVYLGGYDQATIDHWHRAALNFLGLPSE